MPYWANSWRVTPIECATTWRQPLLCLSIEGMFGRQSPLMLTSCRLFVVNDWESGRIRSFSSDCGPTKTVATVGIARDNEDRRHHPSANPSVAGSSPPTSSGESLASRHGRFAWRSEGAGTWAKPAVVSCFWARAVRGTLTRPWCADFASQSGFGHRSSGKISDRLGTDLGTKLHETAPNQCDRVQSLGHPSPSDQCFCNQAGQTKLRGHSS
jgi:hypothetical protein